MSLLKLLAPAPFQQPIEDQARIQQQYRYWRIRILYSLYFGYIFFYFTRKSFTFAMPFMAQDLNFSKTELGMLATILYITYGFGKFIAGVISDKSNTRYFMAFGLIATGIINICFGCSSSIWVFAVLWGLNGWFQAWGWPACTKSLTHWFAKKERGLWWSLCSTSHNVGGGLMPLIAVFLASQFHWRFALWIPGITSIIIGMLLINRLRDVPQSLGLPSVEHFKNRCEPLQTPEKHTLSVKQILFNSVLNNPFVWCLGFTYFFVYILRIAVSDWGVFYFMDGKHYNPAAASATIFWFELGGFIGMLLAGWVTDRLFAGNRLPYCFLCFCGIVVSVYGLGFMPMFFAGKDYLFMSLLGLSIFGPQMLIGLAAAEVVSNQAAATANGFTGLFGYLGAAVAGFPLGFIIDTWSWSGYLTVLALLATLGSILVIITLGLHHRKQLKISFSLS